MNNVSKPLTVTCMISTKDRFFTSLPMALTSVMTQTVLPNALIVFNDGDDVDPRTHPLYEHICKMLDDKKIKWMFAHGMKKGQVHNHQIALFNATTDLIWRLDDDNIAEPTTLERLIAPFSDPKVGAVGGCVFHPQNSSILPSFLSGKIEDIDCDQNIQWFYHPKAEILEVDHLYSTFVYRREYGITAGGYPINLSPACHREETIFTYRLKRAGFRVLINPSAVTWHLRNPQGGIRSFTNIRYWEDDEQIFRGHLKEWGVKTNQLKLIVLQGGLGDHYAFKKIYPEIKARHLDKKFVMAVCYPEVFSDLHNVHLISIQEASICFGNLDKYDIYKWMADKDWKKHLCEAYRELYL